MRMDTDRTREDTWRTFYGEHFEYLYRLICRCGVESGDVEDVTQQVFLIVHGKIIKGEEVQFPKAWLRSIALRVISDRRRWTRVRRVKRWLLESTSNAQRVQPTTPEQNASSLQLQGKVTQTLQKMSPKLRDVLVLCDIEECSVSEAAECLQVPVNTVRSRRRLARESFQQFWIQSRGLDDE